MTKKTSIYLNDKIRAKLGSPPLGPSEAVARLAERHDALRARLVAAMDDARRVCEMDRDKAKSSVDFDAGRYDGLKQALEILDNMS
jgi:hypothetical protein